MLLLANSSPIVRYELFPDEYDKALLYDVDDEGDVGPYYELFDKLIPDSAEETKSTSFIPDKKVIVAPGICFNLETTFEWKDDLVVHVGHIGAWMDRRQAKCLKCMANGHRSAAREPQKSEEHTCGVYYAVMRGDDFVSGFCDAKMTYQLGDGDSVAYRHNGDLYICNSGDVSSVVVIRLEG